MESLLSLVSVGSCSEDLAVPEEDTVGANKIAHADFNNYEFGPALRADLILDKLLDITFFHGEDDPTGLAFNHRRAMLITQKQTPTPSLEHFQMSRP